MSKTISREALKQKLENGTPLTLIEALPKKYFDAEHLPGAINIPHDEIRDKAPGLLKAKDELIVVYCANTACRNSKIATEILHQLGYSNTYEYVEGKQDWLEAGYAVEATPLEHET